MASAVNHVLLLPDVLDDLVDLSTGHGLDAKGLVDLHKNFCGAVTPDGEVDDELTDTGHAGVAKGDQKVTRVARSCCL